MMALSYRNVEIAMDILKEISGMKAPFFNEFDKENPLRTGCILVAGQQQDGWENVFMNFKDISETQLALFEARKNEVHNTSFINDEGEGITCIGWF